MEQEHFILIFFKYFYCISLVIVIYICRPDYHLEVAYIMFM